MVKRLVVIARTNVN